MLLEGRYGVGTGVPIGDVDVAAGDRVVVLFTSGAAELAVGCRIYIGVARPRR
jgi:hypothetical protein